MRREVHVRFCESLGVQLPRATHLVVVAPTERAAYAALQRVTETLHTLGLAPKAEKTRVVHLTVGGDGFDFRGFHHRWVKAHGRTGAKRVEFLARWPSPRAMQHARDRLQALTARSRLRVAPPTVIQDINAFLRGWAAYFRIGNSTRMFDKMERYAVIRVAGFIAKRHRQRARYGWRVLRTAPDRLGLLTLHGLVVAPRPNRPWRGLVAAHRR